MIDDERDREVDDEPVGPGVRRVDHEPGEPARADLLGRRKVEAEEGLPERPAGQREGARLEVLDPPEVGEDVVAVEPHPRVQVGDEGRDERHRRDEEEDAPREAGRRQRPAQEGDPRQDELRRLKSEYDPAGVFCPHLLDPHIEAGFVGSEFRV